ncbi:MAG: polyisoprenoid-binding protein [Bdellovibrionales bacterium]|nr:polyisoprenoid-binding protein [Ramlibacter sp.]
MFRLSILSAVFLASSAMAAPQNFAIDSLHSYPNFAVNHLGMSTVQGRFDKMTGRVVLDEAAKTGSIDIKIATASISTGDAKRTDGARSRDEHLKGPDFFNATEFPEMSYKSTKMVFKGETIESIEGNLTLLGVTRPLKLSVTSFKCGPHPFTKKPMCGADVTGTIKRTDFGMKYGVPAIGDEIKLSINVEALPE